MKSFRSLACVLLGLAMSASLLAAPITLTILHTDDLHGRVEPVKIGSGTYGGYARHVSLVRKLMAEDPNPLLLSGGDSFQGTLYFNVYQGMADLFFMNLMGYDGMAVGNHEFDLGPEPLARFVRHAKFPVLSCNIDLSEEPLLRDLVKPHAVLLVAGEKLGLIGATTPDLHEVSSPGPNVKMLPLTASIEKSVRELESQGVNKIILLSHLGYTLEKEVARTVKGIDVIVGGHSHTLLGTFDNPDFPPSEGPYPTVVDNPGGHKTLLVAAWEWGKVLGRIKVDFCETGTILRWYDAQPIVVDASIPEDPLAVSAIEAMRMPIDQLRREVVARAETLLDGSRELVRRQESTMANVIADAMLQAGKNASVEVAMINGGGVRGSIRAGDVTFEDAIQVQPFGNTLVVLELTGREILAALEHGVSGWEGGEGRLLHVSRGTSYAFDPSRPVGQRIVEAILAGTALEPGRTYRVMVNNFMAGGGDGHQVFKNASSRLETGTLDLDVLVQYLKANPQLNPAVEGRLRRVGEEAGLRAFWECASLLAL
jgi:5'-nucleotidase / UDP-sugar diphosphatase